jgi:uncharacterized protein YggE
MLSVMRHPGPPPDDAGAKEDTMGTRMWIVVSLLGLLGAVGRAQAPVTPVCPPTRTITVTGVAQRQVLPDVALVIVAVETQAETVARAVEANNTAANRVMEAVRRLNIANLTIRTLGFDVEPIYEQPGTQPVNRPLRIVGYRVVNRVEARIPEPGGGRLSESVGRVLDAALGAGANRVDQVLFQLVDNRPVTREVLAEAARDARETAAAMAAAAGVTLGPLQMLMAAPVYQPPMPMAFSRADTASVPIVAGPLTIQATVNAVYEIR